MDDDSRVARWERRAQLPLGGAWLLYLASYAIRVLAHDLPEVWRDLCLAVMLAAWAVFAADYAVRWRLSRRGPAFVRTHVLDAVLVVLPLLRPLRFVAVYEHMRRRRGEPRLALYVRVMVHAGIAAAMLGFVGALAIYQQEHAAPNARIRTFGDAVWWTCATFATVGYGDVTPVTPLGRLIAVGVMACGLGLLGAVIGSFSSWLVQVFGREDYKPPPGEADSTDNTDNTASTISTDSTRSTHSTHSTDDLDILDSGRPPGS